MKRCGLLALGCAFACLAGCNPGPAKEARPLPLPQAEVAIFKVDPATAATVSGHIRFTGKKPARQTINMDQDTDCARLHKNGRVLDEPVAVRANGALANVFVYVKSGLEGKKFAAAAAPVTIDQNGCWFAPRVLGAQTGQELKVTNSDPVTHNIHPLAQVNREWNQSQGPGDAPIERKFARAEVMIRVKCNIHNWMRAFIGVVDHPYFAVTGVDGTFQLPNLPPGTYTVAAWQEQLGTQEQSVTVGPAGKAELSFIFRGE